MKRPNKWYKLCSFVMAVVMLSTTFAPLNVAYAAGELRNRIVYETAEDLSVDSQEDLSQAQSAESEEIVPTPTPVPTEEPAVTAAPEQPDAVLYQDGVVYIYTAQQLAAIGSGQVVCSGDAQAESFGTGDAVLDENGQAVVYGLDARYLLTQDIPLEAGQVWVLPENFAGVFVQEKMDASAPLYNAQTDTIYIYNNYQLQTIAGQDVLKTVLSGDNVAETFGMGQVQYADEAQTQQLEYTAQHNYVVAQTFTAQMPELKAQQVLETAEDTEGRQYKGQVIYVENGKTYILIGNEQQLRAIGSTDSKGNPIKVTEPVWEQKYTYNGPPIIGKWEKDGDPTKCYPGDADISEEALLFDDPQAKYNEVGDDTRPILNIVPGATGSKYFGSKQNGTGTACDESADEYNVNIEREKAGLKEDEPVYSTIANYIIFRDIELTKSSDGSANWKPLMFSGTMEGRLNMVPGENVTISHINVQQTGKLDASQNIGIGFFGTLTNQTNSNNIGLSGGTTVVKDIDLSDVTVSNASTVMKDPKTVVKVLTNVLGGLLGALGGLVDGIISWIPGLGDAILGELSLGDVLGHLLDARAASADTYATGAFAGRIIGDVLVEDCNVKEATVSNVKDMTGGFVGNVEGLTEYDTLSEILDATTGSLESILNLIPGLGLGDLIAILLKNQNLVEIDQLIPSDYKSAQIKNCSVQLSNGAIASGTENELKRFAGGFAGIQTGSVLENCSVMGLTSVTALKYAGGFSGATRDAVIEGLLPKNLDLLDEILAKLQEVIDRTKNIDPSSKVIGCTVQAAEGNTITVNAGEYAGGFTGLAANSDISNSQVQGVSGVSASSITYTQKDELGITKEYQTTGDYAGGFAGRVTLGSSLILAGETDIVNNSLLGEVGSLTENVLTGERAGQLLSVLGVSSSKLQGCKVTGSRLEVSARNYAGGLFGQGDGPEVTVPETSAAQDAVQEAANQVENLVSVTASENYAGGIAGRIVPANAAGAVNKVLGIANALKFTLNSIEVSGAGYTVAAKEFAGGGIGQAFGGTVENVTLDGVKKVSAENYAAGFLAQGGPGSLVNGGGLNLLGLGLIKVNSLLELGDMLPITMKACVVKGSDLLVEATGEEDNTLYFAGGFVGENASGDISNSHVEGLQQVKAKTYAGGFAARSQTGGLAEVGGSNTTDGWLNDLVSIDGLLSTVEYLIPTYTNCYVQFSSNLLQTGAQVEAQYAGGFIGEMQGGTVDNSALSDSTDAVRNVAFIKGTQYAGGFGGKVVSGGLVDSDGLTLLGGLKGLEISLDGLLSVLQAYVPVITSAGVSSVESGLRVQATGITAFSDGATGIVTPGEEGYAGGYAGLVQGARITNSDVKKLATKKAASNTVPNEDDWAVSAPTNAGGYAGQIDIGNAAAVGGGLNALGILDLGNLLSALQVVESRLDRCDVYGVTGGFNVQSTNGSAGGYAGLINGAWINGSDSYDYEYIHGVVSAGGYVGTAQPGDVASVVEKADLLNGLLQADNLLSLAKSFIPRIYNSCTEAVPCGGYVKATGTSDGAILKGMAGGYAGYNQGGRIWGNVNNDPADLSASPTILPDQKLAETKRVREVVGQEFAGGFTGLMKAANIADTGNFSLLYGLVKTEGLLSALEAVYATETNTKTTGPLRDISYEKWNAWVEVVGSQGVYGEEFEEANVNSQDELNRFLENYIYGYTVEALAKDNATGVADGGSAGGYVGRMEAGVITNAYAQDVKSVTAHRSAGGFAGEMVTGTVANVGGLSLGDLKITDNIGLVSTFVPVIYASRTDGYRSGMTITATGESDVDIIGGAGGFAGTIAGGQIWADIPEDEDLKFERVTNKAGEVKNLRSVSGTRYAGGFAGRMDSGSTVTEADVESQSGLLNGILGLIINSQNITALANVLNATIPTVQSAAVNKPIEGEEPMQFSVQDASRAAGGFVGAAQGAVLGKRKESSKLNTGLEVYGVRFVKADEHAGGFFGLADMGGVAQVANEGTSILGILGLNNVDVLNSFRTYFYDCTVKAPADGLSVYALKASADGGSTTDGTDANQVYCTGNAGGFGGSLLNATVLRSSVTGLKLVNGVNYVGGFVGLSGKSGVVDLDNVAIFGKILSAAAGVLDIFGSHIDDSTVTGMDSGFTVSSKGGKDCIAGGFVGYADLSRINAGTVENIKQVYSDAQAGGFAGRTSFAYLAKVDADSPALLEPILEVVNTLLKALYADNLQDLGVININLGNLPLSLKVFSDGNTLSVNLLGLKISVALVKGNGEGVSDVAQVHIGDSYIELPCTEDGVTDTDNIKIGLIKANRTKVADSKITGVSNGYDVFGGGAGNTADWNDPNGYAGGFVGYNNEGLLENNNMYQADTIRGTSGLVGEFSGKTSLETEYPNINNLQTIEGSGNCYRVYRINTQGLDQIKKDGTLLTEDHDPATGNETYDVYTVLHRGAAITENKDQSLHSLVWQDAYLTADGNQNAQFPVNVYLTDAEACLMLGVKTEQNTDGTDPEDGAAQDPCAEEALLTIHKIWVDNNNPNRPEKIAVTVQGGPTDITVDMSKTLQGTDPNIWTYTTNVPVRSEDGKYVYTVSEEPLDGYLTIYYQDPNDPYTFYIFNILQTIPLVKDTVVIDYGLSVDVDVLANDLFEQYHANPSVVGVLPYEESKDKLNTVWKDGQNDWATAATTYGTAEVKGGNSVRYTLNGMEMKSLDRMLYVVQMPEESVKNGQNYMAGLLTVIPATEIFYEDNFNAISYNPGKTNGDADIAWEKYTDSGFTTSDVQDTDRPTEDLMQQVWDDWYGNDTHYADDVTYSNGTVHYVSVDENTKTSPNAQFRFTGTGFDVISVTSGDTGVVNVTIKQNGERVASYTIDTYYGYKYDQESGKWVADTSATGENALYQIPILKVKDLDYGTYDVTITPQYFKSMDAHYSEAGENAYSFYLDAIRVYDPADQNNPDYKEIEEVYKKDNQSNPDFKEIRDAVLSAGKLTETQEGGVVFVDGNDTLSDMADYATYGPKNELYLAPGQAISFYLWTDCVPDKIEFGAKLANGNSATLRVETAVQAGDSQWDSFRSQTYTINSAYDMYYNLDAQCVWEAADTTQKENIRGYKTKYPIVIRNASEEGALISLTNLRWTNAQKSSGQEQTVQAMRTVLANAAYDPYEIVATASWENVEAAYYLLNPLQKYFVTVKYQDSLGNKIAEDMVQTVYEGSEYDVSALAERALEGYNRLEVRGAVSGVANGNVEIVVVYEKVDAGALPETQPSATPNPGQTKPGQSVVNTGAQAPAGDTAANLPGVIQPQQNNLGGPYDIPDTSVQEKVEGTLEFVKKWAEQQANMKNVALIVMGIAIVAAAVLTTTVKKRKSE